MEKENNLSRKEQASEIIRNPENYKKCEICSSLLLREIPICPNCQGYRFDSDPNHVADQALGLATSEQRSILPGDLAS